MKKLIFFRVPSLIIVLLMLSTYGIASAQASVNIKDSTNVRTATSAATQVRSIHSGIYKRISRPDLGCEIGENPNVPQAAFTVFSYLLSHNYSPPTGYKGNTVYGNTTHKLPSPPAGYRWFEYDVQSGAYSRSAERIVTARTGLFTVNGYPYYSPDHYDTFVPMYICITKN